MPSFAAEKDALSVKIGRLKLLGLPETLGLIAAAGAVCFLLFIPPTIGLADQQDFDRVMEGAGIRYPPALPEVDKHWFYFHPIFELETPYKHPFSSPESLFVVFALFLNGLAGNHYIFDLHILGILHAVAFLGMLYLLLRCAARLRLRTRILLSVLVVLVGCDVGYIAYFNSFYLEPSTYIFGLLFIGSVVWMLESPEPTLRQLTAVIASAALLLSAKSQNIPLLPAPLLFLAFGLRRGTPRTRQWAIGWTARGVLAAGFLYSLLSTVGVSDAVQRKNLYNEIFMQVLPFSPAPDADLRSLGLDPQVAAASGTSVFELNIPYYDPRVFPARCSYARLAIFYLTHPGRLWMLTKHGMAQALTNHTPELGNYERSAGHPPQALTPAMSWWDSWRGRLREVWLLGPLMLLNLLVPLVCSLRAKDVRTQILLQLHSTVAAMAVLAFYTAVMADGNEFQRHLFASNFFVDCCIVADLLWLAEKGAAFLAAARKAPVRRAVVPAAACLLLVGGLWGYSKQQTGPLGGDETVVGFFEPKGEMTLDGVYSVTVKDGSEFPVAGWTACADPTTTIEKVEVLINNLPMLEMAPSIETPALAAQFHRPNFGKAAWKSSFRIHDLPPADYRMTIRGVCANGQTARLPGFQRLYVVR
jgi:hypothetical protein